MGRANSRSCRRHTDGCVYGCLPFAGLPLLFGEHLLEAGELFGGGAAFDGADRNFLHLGVGFFRLREQGRQHAAHCSCTV